jgi:hypothetical protein
MEATSGFRLACARAVAAAATTLVPAEAAKWIYTCVLDRPDVEANLPTKGLDYLTGTRL